MTYRRELRIFCFFPRGPHRWLTAVKKKIRPFTFLRWGGALLTGTEFQGNAVAYKCSLAFLLNWPYSYTRYWTGISLQMRPMRVVFSNAYAINLFLMIFPAFSLHSKLVPVLYPECKYYASQLTATARSFRHNVLTFPASMWPYPMKTRAG